MAAHDLNRLSSIDFEELIHDLLQAEWSIKLEAFSAGRDGGIDLRHIASNGTTIIQCKHFAGSGFQKLLSHLRNEELPKIAKLNPQRYVLATSVGLTPANKNQLLGTLSPFVRAQSDIIGASDIETFLRAHPDVEKTHYKLWLTSAAVLERVLHSAERCQTDFEIDRIRRKLPLFVQSEAHPRALKILEEGRVAIIAGQPGIGKSTLAEMLIYAHMEDGYEPVAIQSDISEGRKLYRPDRKQIFYFDDFLGQTYLGDRPEYFGRNQDSALSDFVEMIGRSENGRFILTTREHIFGGALQRSERIAQGGLSERRCLLELSDYKRSQKARILFNHLYFSELSEAYKQAILADNFFLAIIDHDNFNPRIVEWLSSFARVKKVPPESYQAHVRQLLDEPEHIWRHAFDHQISRAGRNLLVALYSVGVSDDVIDLEPTWRALHTYGASRYNYTTSPADFRAGLKELDGSFITIRNASVSFLNPSIRDFLAATISANADLVRDILESATRFRQIGVLWQLRSTQKYAGLYAALVADQPALFRALSRLLQTPVIRWTQAAGGLRGTTIDHSEHARAMMAMEIAGELRSPEALAFVTSAFEELLRRWEHEWWGMHAALEVLRTLTSPEASMLQIDHTFRGAVMNVVKANFYRSRSDDWLSLLSSRDSDAFWSDDDLSALALAFEDYRYSGLDDEHADCGSISELEELKENLERMRDRFGHNFEATIGSLEERIAERSENREEEDGSALKWTPPSNVEQPISDDTIKGMFATLVGTEMSFLQ
jgi:hypothetical protein